jgi:RNA polymerase sigma factor (sigma-70 family)
MQPKRLVQLGEPALADLYQRYAPEIFAYLRMHTATHEDAEDLLVEVFLAALEQTRFSAIPLEKRRGWLWRVARNKTIDLYRQTRQRPATRLDELADDLYFNEALEPEHHAMRTERSTMLARHIQQLPPAQRQVVYLHFVHGLRSRNIAEIMEKREGTVRMLLSRALNALRSFAHKETSYDQF